jgi:thiol:disulfide interchange protein DsbA
VTFRSQPAAFNDGWTQLARTYYAIEVLGETEKLHGEVFNAIHRSKKLDPKILAKDPKTLFAWVGSQKVDEKKFTDAYNSFSVVSRAQRTVDTTSAYGVTGTPSIAIDGRYVTAPHMLPSKNNAVDYDGFFKTVDALIAMARTARKGK